MLLFDIPSGTTVDGLFTDVLPSLHRKLVPAEGAPAEEFRAVARLEGGKSYTLVIRGREMEVREGEEGGTALWVSVAASTVRLFLDDWAGPRRFAPKQLPRTGVLLLTDPRLLKRLVMMSGRIELAISDFPDPVSARPGRVTMTVAAGPAAKKGIATDDPDAIIEARLSSVERLLSGDLPPEEALDDAHVAVRGKRFVAMQLALALAPFYPAG